MIDNQMNCPTCHKPMTIDREATEERAAIMEYMGELPRKQAEKMAEREKREYCRECGKL